MKAQRFENAKKALIQEMLQSKVHCADSIYAVKQCTGLKSLITTLNKFVTELRYKRFPSIGLVREYFSEEIEELNELGVFVDQKVNVRNIDNVWLFGHCTGTISSDRIKFFYVIVNDDADVTINALPYTLQHVYVKAPKQSIVSYNKANSATQIITINK